jgi:hypothetical protein
MQNNQSLHSINFDNSQQTYLVSFTMDFQPSNESDVADHMDTDHEKLTKPVKPTINSGLCRDTIARAFTNSVSISNFLYHDIVR